MGWVRIHDVRTAKQVFVIYIGIEINPEFFRDIGLEQSPAKSTMSDGNAKRDYRVYEHLYHSLKKH